MSTLEHFHTALKTELELTQKYIVAFSESKDKLANKAIKHIIKNKGKMLRPILLILAGNYTYLVSNEDKKTKNLFVNDLTKAAAILELIQMSSLIHDDVLDQSSQRRNKSTLNKLKGNRFAILLGDYLVAQSLKNCYDLVHDAERLFDTIIMKSFLESIAKLVLGEVQQNNFNNKKDNKQKEIDSYLEIIENKTASLFSLACFVGATIGSNNKDHAEILKQFGHHIGMAYQIIDDLRDYALSKNIAGENNFQDMKFGIKTLPLIFAGQFSQNGEQEKLNNCFNTQKELSESDKSAILDILQKTGGITNTMGEAKSHILKARILLYKLPENEYSVLLGEFINYLSQIGDEVVDDILSVKTN